jgi:DNA polymerase-3 subunit delta'
MDFQSLLGNEPIKAYLQKAIHNATLSHALLFSGPDGVGKSLFAKVVAKKLLQSEDDRVMKETHPDFHVLRPEGKTGLHSMERLREMIDEVYTTAFEAPAKVFVIHDAERMQTASANAILKTLEEPTPDTTLILLTSQQSEILPTIRSRTVRLSFQPLSEKEVASFLKEQNLPLDLAKHAQGSLRKALDLTEMEPLRKSVFLILSKRLSYPLRSQEIEKLESGIEDEDPMKRLRKVEHIFASILMWQRDQTALQINIPKESLFFNDTELKTPSFSLEKLIRLIDEARSAFERNIKFSTCLESIFSPMLSNEF